MGDPIVGNESVTLTEHGPGAREPKMMTSPKSMTAIQRAKHWITHLPYDPDCEICIQSKRPNEPHHLSLDTSRDVPLIVGDYGFIRDSVDQDTTTVCIMKLYPLNILFACAVASKSPDPLVVTHLARFIKDVGMTHFAYRSDREPAMMGSIEEACARTGHTGTPIKPTDASSDGGAPDSEMAPGDIAAG